DLPWQYHQRVNRAMSKIDVSQPQPQLHTDIPRLREGGVGGQFWSVYVPATMEPGKMVQATMEQIDVVYNLLRLYSETFQLALTADDVESAFQEGKIASLIGMEGGHSIDNSLATLRMFHNLGARYMTLTHSKNVDWADSCTDIRRANGLTNFGKVVVREMNRLGMLVDLSHVSADTMRSALEVAEAPVIFSHSSARTITNHSRNVPDDVLKLIPENGGVVMVTFVPGFVSELVYEHDQKRHEERQRLEKLRDSTASTVDDSLREWDEANPAPRATISDIADHIDHIRSIVGIDHIGIGSDFDGITSVPLGLVDVSKYPMLTAELLRREYSDEDVLNILGRNILRVMREVEGRARDIQKERPPSEALIEDLDG
ncbi:MAG: dipeptidase, partial [Ardenticatenaceae bacterium]